MQKLVNTLFFIVLISLVLFFNSCTKNEAKNIEIITLTDSAIVVKDTFFINNKMIRIPSANFTMGCNFFNSPDCESDEFPIFRVQLSDYDISSIEVTQGLWILIMGNNPSFFNTAPDDSSYNENLLRPVENVSWDSVQYFISKLNLITKRKFRLPTEAEWEYAARGSDSNKFLFPGNSYLDNVAWYQDNSDGQPHFVKQKLPNSFGLYDMAGNVSEWCADYYGPYSASTKINPQGPTSGTYRIIRGGSFNYSTIYCRLSYRDNGNPTQKYIDNGFRLAETVSTTL